jgi:hypothetical protein
VTLVRTKIGRIPVNIFREDSTMFAQREKPSKAETQPEKKQPQSETTQDLSPEELRAISGGGGSPVARHPKDVWPPTTIKPGPG